MQLPTQKQFVKDCLAKYRWEPIPSDQKWEDAHYPLPACSGEHDTVLLWSADHTVQGLLQSVELDHKCFHHSANKKDLYNLETHYPQYLELFQQLKLEFCTRGGKKSAAIHKANGTAFYDPKVQSTNGKKGGEKCAELGLGIHGQSAEQMTAYRKKGGEISGARSAELGLGAHAPGMQSAGGKIGGKIVGNQRWQCLVTGHISNPGGLSTYQKKRGIDTKLRVKLNYTGS